MEESAIEFIKELEAKRGAKVTWKTYATWYADTNGVLREYGVFMYRCEDTLYYEDFERKPSILGIPVKPAKNAQPYVKFEGAIPLKTIVDSKQVTKNTAMKVAGGSMKSANAKAANAFQRLFSNIVEMVTLADGTTLFLELMDRKAFNALWNR